MVSEVSPRIVNKKGASPSQQYCTNRVGIERFRDIYFHDDGYSILKKFDFLGGLDSISDHYINKSHFSDLILPDLLLIEIARIKTTCSETAAVIEMLDDRNINGGIWTLKDGGYFFKNSDLNDKNPLLYKVLAELEKVLKDTMCRKNQYSISSKT